jgi:hypothetical protein
VAFLAWLLLLGSTAAGAEDECARLAKMDPRAWWVHIDELIRLDAAVPWLQQRPLTGLGCLAKLAPAREDEVLVDLLERGAPVTKHRTAWTLLLRQAAPPGEGVFRSLVKLLSVSGEESNGDRELEKAVYWARKVVFKSAKSSPTAAEAVLASLRWADYCYNGEAYEAALTINTEEARKTLLELQRREKASEIHNCDLDLADAPPEP